MPYSWPEDIVHWQKWCLFINFTAQQCQAFPFSLFSCMYRNMAHIGLIFHTYSIQVSIPTKITKQNHKHLQSYLNVNVPITRTHNIWFWFDIWRSPSVCRDQASSGQNLDCDKPGLVCRPESMFTAVLPQTPSSSGMCGEQAGFSLQIAAVLDHRNLGNWCGNTKKNVTH